MKINTFKSIILISTIALLSLTVAACSKKEESKASVQETPKKEVVVYSYDSFVGEWGPGPELEKLFEQKTGLDLVFVDCGDAVQAYNKALLEKDNVRADVIVGIDNNLADKARASGILEPYTPKDAVTNISSTVASFAQSSLGNDGLLTAYDYGHFAIIYDSESSVPAPTSLEDLTKEIYKKKIILMDGRTSTPGLGFVAWTLAVYGDKYEDYWKALAPNILTMTSGWSEGWGMFQNGEAPLCVSYTTSPAYCVEYEDTDRYKTLLFDQGHVLQVEGYGLLKNAPNPDGGKLFMDFLISKEAQEVLLLTQWMYPVNPDVDLPQSYKSASPIPAKTLSVDSADVNRALDRVTEILSAS
ncbi:MAG: thiamine ABC transporter substrate-binding protein [Treponema sp.]|nr:thiamine ABC transporter substrate-binding protein [Treponema sp.]